jgi:hypothetical protein
MKPLKLLPARPCRRTRYRLWLADLTSRHGWFRVLLHLAGMVRRPRHWRWHWQHIVHELHDRDRPQ